MTAPQNDLYTDSAARVPDALARVSREFMRTADRLPTLFTIDDQMLSLLALMDDDEFGHDAALALINVAEIIGQKVEGYVSVIRSLEAMADARKAEAERMAARSLTASRKADWLKDLLLTHMKSTGQQRIETARFTVRVQANSVPTVEIVDAAAVPKEFERTKITIDIDKKSIAADFKATGVIPPGCNVTRGEHLRIS